MEWVSASVDEESGVVHVWPLDEHEQDRLRGRLKSRVTGRAAITAQVAIEDHWERVCWLAWQYGQPPLGYHRDTEGELRGELWKDAASQWGTVEDAARALGDALTRLGVLACAIRQDAAITDQGLWRSISSWLPVAPGTLPIDPPHQHLEAFARLAKAHATSMQARCNGSKRGDASGKRDFLVASLEDLLQCPCSHAIAIARAIHQWAEGNTEPVFGERGGERISTRIKKVRSSSR